MTFPPLHAALETSSSPAVAPVFKKLSFVHARLFILFTQSFPRTIYIYKEYICKIIFLYFLKSLIGG